MIIMGIVIIKTKNLNTLKLNCSMDLDFASSAVRMRICNAIKSEAEDISRADIMRWIFPGKRLKGIEE